jgi:hypothetical protein
MRDLRDQITILLIEKPKRHRVFNVTLADAARNALIVRLTRTPMPMRLSTKKKGQPAAGYHQGNRKPGFVARRTSRVVTAAPIQTRGTLYCALVDVKHNRRALP